MQSIAVFCGSNFGKLPVYEAIAKQVGEELAQKKIRLIYGGGDVGLMGVVASTTLKAGGEVLGVIPDFLINIEGRTAISEQIEVSTMHERKQIMAEKADGFLILPGGYGTMDEFFEILTWRQLKLHNKPIGLLNVGGYYDFLIAQFDKMIEEGFVHEEGRNLLVVGTSVQELLLQMEATMPPEQEEYLERG